MCVPSNHPGRFHQFCILPQTRAHATQVLVLGSVTAARPHLINIKGYPAGLSVLDFLELAEAGKTFDKVWRMVWEAALVVWMGFQLHIYIFDLTKNLGMKGMRRVESWSFVSFYVCGEANRHGT